MRQHKDLPLLSGSKDGALWFTNTLPGLGLNKGDGGGGGVAIKAQQVWVYALVWAFRKKLSTPAGGREGGGGGKGMVCVWGRGGSSVGGLGSPPGEGAALKLVWCNSNLVSGISVGIALCVLPE